LHDVCVFVTKTTEGGKTDVADVGRLEWDHVNAHCFIDPEVPVITMRGCRARANVAPTASIKAG
jgi:hypothetical protein